MSRIKQSFSWDGFARTGIGPEKLVRGAAEIGYEAVELVGEELFPLITSHGLKILSITGHPLSPDGVNRRENRDYLEKEVTQKLALAQKWRIPNLLCFSGNRYGIDEIEAAEIAAENLSYLAKLVASAGVTLLMELLNSKVKSRDYQADNTAWAVKVCQMVASPNVNLLYDIYHMQIMEGDIINTIRQNHVYFGHYHTAGNPGRGDLDDTQELYYPAIIRAILDTGYTGYVGHEFFPKGEPLASLKAAFDTCNVEP
jgi:hydroxypyruvate isomerase